MFSVLLGQNERVPVLAGTMGAVKLEDAGAFWSLRNEGTYFLDILEGYIREYESW